MRGIAVMFLLVGMVFLEAQGAARFVSKAEPNIEFPPDFYSFGEIARRLSVGGRAVSCASDLRARVALIALRPRSWESTRDLLEAALDIAIVPLDQERKRWQLRRAPEVVRREKQWRDQLARMLAQRLDERNAFRQRTQAILGSLPLSVLVEETPTLLNIVADFRNRVAALSAGSEQGTPSLEAVLEVLQGYALPPLSEPLLQWAHQVAKDGNSTLFEGAGAILPRLSEEQKAKLALVQLGLQVKYFRRGVMAAWLYEQASSYEGVRRALENGKERQQVRLEGLSPSLVQWFLEEEESDGKGLSDTLLEPLWGVILYDLLHRYGEIQVKRGVYIRANGTVYRLDGDDVSVRTSTDSLSQLFEQLDTNLSSRYTEASQRHEALLKESVLRRTVALSRVELGALYPLLRRWAQDTGQEVIAEVYLSRATYSPDRVGTTQGGAKDESAVSLAEVARVLDDEGVWRVERIGDVWVWRNWFAFVDRVPPLPYAALLQLTGSARTPTDWRQFLQQTSPEQLRWLATMPNRPNIESLFGHPEYLGPPRLVADRAVLFSLLDGLVDWTKVLREGGQYRYWLREVPLPRLRRWVALLQQMGVVLLGDKQGLTVELSSPDLLLNRLVSEGWVSVSVFSASEGYVDVKIGAGKEEWLGGRLEVRVPKGR